MQVIKTGFYFLIRLFNTWDKLKYLTDMVRIFHNHRVYEITEAWAQENTKGEWCVYVTPKHESGYANWVYKTKDEAVRIVEEIANEPFLYKLNFDV